MELNELNKRLQQAGYSIGSILKTVVGRTENNSVLSRVNSVPSVLHIDLFNGNENISS